MSMITSVGEPDKVVAIKLPGGRRKCPSCGGVEPNEYVLTINHGFSDSRDPGYWWVNHGTCWVLQNRLFRMGWYPLGWGPTKDLQMPGRVLTIGEERDLERAFDRARPWYMDDRDVDPAVVAAKVAEELVPILLDKLLDRLGDVDLLDVSDRIRTKAEARIERRLRELMAEYEAQGVAFGSGESLDRALNALCEAEGLVPSGNEEP